MASKSPKRIVITGGAGFIGSQLGWELWRQGHDVVLLDSMWSGSLDNLVIEGRTFGSLIARDVRDENLTCVLEGCDTVFHLAGVAALPVCQSQPQFAYSVNTAGVANVLEASRLAGVRRVVFSSTSAVYENSHGPLHRESDSVSPDLVYSMTKHAAECVCAAYAKNYGMDIIIARFFNVYGPHQDFRRQSPPFTSYIAREISAGRSPQLYNASQDAKRDYVYVADVIRLLVLMMESTKTYHADIYNVASGVGYSVPEIYEMMLSAAGKRIEPVFLDPRQYWSKYEQLFCGGNGLSLSRVEKEVYKSAIGDATRAQTEFNWHCQVPMEQGLVAVYEYALAHR